MPLPKDAKRYNAVKIRLKLVDILFVVIYLALFQIFVSSPLKALAFSATPNFSLAFTAYILAFSILHYIVDLPLHFYSSFIVERRFGMSNQRFPAWLTDDAKKGFLSLVVFLVFIQALYLFLRIFPATWWAWIAVFWFTGTVLIARIMPTFIIPLFFKYYPVSDTLKESIIELSKICGMKIIDVYKIDFSKKTNRLNAAVVGMGKTRRVILADNLVGNFTADEIRGVLAHEFGHHKMRHIWKLISFGALATLLSFYALFLVSTGIAGFLKADSVSDIKIFPVFMLVLFITAFIMMPVQNWFSRRLERAADIFALKMTRNKDAFVSLMTKLSEKNLADPNPSKIVKFLFYTHPPISERIKLAEKF